MGTHSDHLNEKMIRFIENQKMFFVATAAPTGRVNVSPKGLDSLRVLGPNRIIWLNLTGSGNETAAHLLESPRMTVMFCAFEGPPLILRAYGEARNIRPESPEWPELIAHFPPMAGARQIYDLSVDLTLSSCGMGVPLMGFEAGRGETMLEPGWAERGEDGVREYQRKKNRISLDGRPTDIA